MTTSIELGRIFGIRIGINWSWLVVFALILWTLASGIFPETNPGLSDGTYLAMAIVASVLFFSSLLLHELGHAVQARREGMEIDGITLWLFGGVAKFKGMFPSAGAEFRIAIAGPLVTLALGLLFAVGAWLISGQESVDAVVAWLGYINLMLLVFNLLPALPLDGGRVLRSALWRVRGDFRSATRVAAGVGRGFAFLLIAGGVALLIFQGSFSGAWLAFIGWFLLQAATAEDRYVVVSEALKDLRVRDLMVRDPLTVQAGMSLGQFMDEVAWSRRYTTYPVMDDGRVVGLLAFRCVAEVPRAEWDQRSVRECMIERDQVPTLDEDETAVEALAELSEADIHRGLVVDGERLAGLISITDLARALEVGVPRRRRAA
ncbi:MAG: site-2 protease family protein [Gaiellaceae bacterium]